jgi:hypothetical protein
VLPAVGGRPLAILLGRHRLTAVKWPRRRLGVGRNEGEPPVARGADAVAARGADPGRRPCRSLAQRRAWWKQAASETGWPAASSAGSTARRHESR